MTNQLPNPPEDDYIDEVVLDAALAGRIDRETFTERLTRREQVWLVSELTRRGDTAQEICKLIKISRRTVYRLRNRSVD